MLFKKSYYLVPDETGAKAYALLRKALARENKVGVAKVSFRDKEHLAALRFKDEVFVLETMYWPDEIRVADFDTLDSDGKVRDNEVEMAKQPIDSLSGPWNPEEFTDEYRQALLGIVEKKIAGEPIEAPEEAPAARVVDLMAALKASVEAAKSKTPAAKPAAKRSTSKKASSAKKKTAAKKPAAKRATTTRKKAVGVTLPPVRRPPGDRGRRRRDRRRRERLRRRRFRPRRHGPKHMLDGFRVPGFDPRLDSWLVLDPRGQPAGFGIVEPEAVRVVGAFGRVHPEHRGRGIGLPRRRDGDPPPRWPTGEGTTGSCTTP